MRIMVSIEPTVSMTESSQEMIRSTEEKVTISSPPALATTTSMAETTQTSSTAMVERTRSGEEKVTITSGLAPVGIQSLVDPAATRYILRMAATSFGEEPASQQKVSLHRTTHSTSGSTSPVLALILITTL